MTFSDKIKVAREQAGLTQQQLADSTGVSKRTIASYESGGAIARASTMLKLAKALNISSKYLSDDSCLDPMADIEKDGYLEEAQVNGTDLPEPVMLTSSSETMLRCSQVVNCPRNRKTSSLRRSCGRMSPARMKQR